MENSVNPYLVEKTYQEEVVTTVTKTTMVIDWSKVPNGTYMTAEINGMPREGIVWNNPSKPDEPKYFCQSKNDGADAPFKFGFRFSWQFSQNDNGLHGDVTNIQFPPKPEDLVIPQAPPFPIEVVVGNGSYGAKVMSEDKLIVGCQIITKEQILNVLAEMEKIGKQ